MLVLVKIISKRVFHFFFISFLLSLTRWTPSSLSIMVRISSWSFMATGAMEMSLTIRNCPQLLRCSFSRRMKFQTNLLNTSRNCRTHPTASEGMEVN